MAGNRGILPAVALAAATLVGAGAAAAAGSPWHAWWGSVSSRAGTYVLESAPPTSPAETHSALLTSPAAAGDQPFAVTVTTLAQLRSGTAPNPWEVGWTMFRFRDLADYYWFILKPNGWELGKKQGSLQQVFLATGSSPRLVLGRPARIAVDARGAELRISVDGTPVVDYVDPHPLPPGGSVGLYEEDSRVRFDHLSFTGQ